MPVKNARNPVTMKDVARLAGVSQSTVSRVLSPSASPIPISQETTEKVLQAIEQLGYRPNLAARSLRGQKTNMIAIMIADISNPMYHTIVRTVQAIAREREYDVLIANTDHVYENEIHFIEAMLRRPVDGVLMVPYQLTNDDLSELIAQVGAPLVVLAWPGYFEQVDTVFVDDERATREAVQWLIEAKGHQRIGFIGVSRALPPGERRRQGYQQAMAAFHLPVPAGYIREGDFTIESGQRAMRELLSLPEPPTAVFACNDRMAIGALDAASAMHVRVPQDVALVGFDNIPETAIIRPRLTTIDQNAAAIGEQMARALFERIEGTASEAGRIYEIPCQLIEREST